MSSVNEIFIGMRAKFVELEKRLDEQRERLVQLGKAVTRMQRVYDAAKRFVMTPLTDQATTDRHRIALADAVFAAIKADAPNPRNAISRDSSD